ncbi:C39 family peptidase [Ammoniphilus sp. CFH 90114]|uniref:C39 family peptidase n=1 Tax=Ammoniphilus sp. CFH 90114 TaxID=2493665 RepID=UPI00100E5AD2|nr:C39 family peptidase [Ammoniphilus sp. CFH 90114]RXT07106.1 peptidase C39 family protein [Ammoniphilus sp. CFH 90114]
MKYWMLLFLTLFFLWPAEIDAKRPHILLDVPIVKQKPELPRGCEVTSLAMILLDENIKANKMTLAKQVDKVPYKGHPNVGFVGNMYDKRKPGYGVYHKPIEKLARRYAGQRVKNLTGSSFDQVLSYVSNGHPVWIITNATFRPLPYSAFETWKTKHGDVKITWHEHSVVIVGYDQTFVYINNPLSGKNKRYYLKDFRQAWEQMGKQAITIL